MAVDLHDHFVPCPGMAQQGAEIAHRPTGDEQRSLHANHLGGPFLQAMDGGVLVPNVVAHFRDGHCLPHRFGRQREGITPQLDDARHQPSLPAELCIDQGTSADDLGNGQVGFALNVDLQPGLQAAG